MTPEQLAALEIEPIGEMFLHEGGGFTEIWHKDRHGRHKLYTNSDLMKVCAAYEARVAELEGVLDRAANFIISKTFHDEEFDEIHASNCAALRNSSPLTALEEYRKKVLLEAAEEIGLNDSDFSAKLLRKMAEEAGK